MADVFYYSIDLMRSLPRNEKEKFETPPLTLQPGNVAYKSICKCFF
jgi:hypothetical protein